MNYHYLDAQSREIGPVPIDALGALRAAGSLTDGTLVRPESGGPWAQLATVIGSSSQTQTSQPSHRMQAASAAVADAHVALTHLLSNPAAGLPSAWQNLGEKRAVAAGTAMLVSTVFLVLVVINFSSSFSLIRPSDLGSFLKLTLAIAGALGTWVIALVGTQKIFSSGNNYGGSLLTAGSLSILWAFGLLAFVLLGVANLEALAVIALAIACINVLQLFVGLTKVLGVGERPATWAIPVIIIICAWLTKVIFAAIFPILDSAKDLIQGFTNGLPGLGR